MNQAQSLPSLNKLTFLGGARGNVNKAMGRNRLGRVSGDCGQGWLGHKT